MNKKMLICAFIALSFAIVSCDRNKVYEEYVEITDNVWQNKNAVNFEFEIDDTTSLHNIFINVRHATHYPYNNLWVFIKSSAPNGQINIDTVECILADKQGRWKGDGLGDLWDMQIPWKQNVRFPHTGKYRVEFQQGMRVDALPGIMDMGLRIEKIDTK